MKLILVRHGQTDWNRDGRCQGVADIELNDFGRLQIEELALSLRHEEIVAVYSSDLIRARDTAVEIARHHELEVKIDPDIREMDQGELEGLMFDEIRERYAHVLEEWRESPETLRLPKGESLVEVQARAWRAFQALQSRHMGETVVAVSHNLTIMTLLCKISGDGLGSFRKYNMDAASKHTVLCSNRGLSIEVFNDVSHLNSLSTNT